MLPNLLRRKITSGKKLTIENYYRLCAKSDLTWRYIANFRPWLEYRRIQTPLNQSHKHLLDRLARDGIVVTSAEELIENANLFQELETSVREKETLLADEIQQARAKVYTSERNKGYFLPLLGQRPSL